jgi:SOS response regulatory protein OraA/RecX
VPREQDPVQVAVRALRHRDLSAAAVDARLERAGIDEAEREQALETLERVGYLDDARFATGRAQSLAARGWGDAGIEADLERQGIDADGVIAALAALAPEHERAAAIVAARGAGPKTAAYLMRHGFGDDALALARVAEDG